MCHRYSSMEYNSLIILEAMGLVLSTKQTKTCKIQYIDVFPMVTALV